MSERKPFSARYGLRDDNARSHDVTRHTHPGLRDDCEPDPHFRCRCPGAALATRPCCCRIDAADMLCRWCRDGCLAKLAAGRVVPILMAAGGVR